MTGALQSISNALAVSGRALGFSARSLARQPARTALAILGVAAVGALLFDMLLLSQGLIVSMRNLLEQSGYDVRVAVATRPGGGPLIPQATDLAARIAALPEVRGAVTLRSENALVERDGEQRRIVLQGVGGSGTMPWTVTRGAAPGGPRELLVSQTLASTFGLTPGTTVVVRGDCSRGNASPPPLTFRVAGVASFPFEATDGGQAATTAAGLADACGDDLAHAANAILITSRGDAAAAARAINEISPGSALTNEQAVGRIEETGFTYFRQISAVLTTVTLSFALLLIAVLLTVSVNQRLGAIAALRALGFSRGRVIADVLFESALIVGIGGALSLPVGALLALWLDGILKRMPNIPVDLHFFVFEWRAVGVHAALLAITAVLAALYPMRIVGRLPIAATLREEVIG